MTSPRTVAQPVAATSSPATEYRAGLARGVLPYQRCTACDRAVFQPRVVCPHCGAAEPAWHESAGTGTVYSVTVVRSRTSSRVVALIDLDEGFRMMCSLDAPPEHPVAIGSRVRAVVPPGTTVESLTFREVAG